MSLLNAGERADRLDVHVCKCPHINLVLVDSDQMPIAYRALTPDQARALAAAIVAKADQADAEKKIGVVAGRA